VNVVVVLFFQVVLGVVSILIKVVVLLNMGRMGGTMIQVYVYEKNGLSNKYYYVISFSMKQKRAKIAFAFLLPLFSCIIFILSLTDGFHHHRI